ncbi:MAG: hypothetical protein A2Z97_10390 [Bdellovibrionales bacterium GWB1_52_6]|nr:MAG: hypothetical protein A2Z97_10390 [Bdellovibrionales bacterium GWB1_52_6]
MEEALARITSEAPTVVGSGRTDAGVHALGQVVHFVLRAKEWDTGILLRALNSLLASRIQVLEVRPVGIEFHAQRSAVKKQYSYYFQEGPAAVPHLKHYSFWVKRPLNIALMHEAVSALIGEHDFKPFQASGARPGSTVRQILEAEVTRESLPFPGGALGMRHEIGLVRVRVVGTGFLKQMVRGIAGTLLQVGENRRHPACTREILASGVRAEVGPTAPARGLWLEQVWYPEHFGL